MAVNASGETVLGQLRRLPGGGALLDLAQEHDGEVELVGGAVRDLMLGSTPRELDVVVDGDAYSFAEALAQRIHAPGADGGGGRHEVNSHERFCTALISWDGGEIDVAMRRTEFYSSPGALPDVAPGTPEQDLARRDFTVNAIAVALTGAHRGALRAAPGALEDMAEGRLRVLHDRSFIDDPTRILRLARYAARLRFAIEPRTAALAAAAIAAGALSTVSGQRLGAELRLALAESDPSSAFAELDRIGVFAGWAPGVNFDEQVARLALEILPEDGSTRVLLTAALLFEQASGLEDGLAESAMRGFLHDLQLPSGEAERVFGAAVGAALVSRHINTAHTTAALLELLAGTPIESLALAAGECQIRDGPGSYGRRVVEQWLREQRHIVLRVTGADLLAAGVPEGPEIGARLQESYKLLLEGRIAPGRDTELRAALEASI